MKPPKIKPRIMWVCIDDNMAINAVYFSRWQAEENRWAGEIIKRVFVTAPPKRRKK